MNTQPMNTPHTQIQRRQLLLAAGSSLVGTLAGSGMGWAHADMPKVQSLEEAQRWLDTLDKAVRARTTGVWPLVAVLEHLAQSIEMSLSGYPEPKSALFQNTVGAAAFGVFKWRGRMSHTLSEPIPGAQALAQQGDWRPAAVRLRTAVLSFEAHSGALKPHFAYGALSKADFARAHSMHIANHQDEIVLA